MTIQPRWIQTVTQQAKDALPLLPWARGQNPVLVLRPLPATAATTAAATRRARIA